MTIAGSTMAPKQDRSRATLKRLLDSTIKVLDHDGLEGAVVPRIAAMAEVAPASIYRRFADKDALLRAAFLHLLATSNEVNRERMEAMLLRGSLKATTARLMDLLMDQYRRHPRLFRALLRFLDRDDDVDFARQARGHMAENVDQLVNILLAFRKEIRHRSPRHALQFAVLSAVSAMEAFALESDSLWHSVLTLSEDQFKRELARAFLAGLTEG